jgi:tetratricopeptide (TPR) repeat protein
MSKTADELITLGYQSRREGRPQDAKASFTQAVELCRESGDRSLLASALTGLGQIERDLKNRGVAIEHYREAVEILRSGPDQIKFAHTMRHLGDILRGDGSMEEARPCYEEALRIYRSHSETSPLDLANAIRGFALLKGAVGEAEESKLLWREARGLYESVNVEPGVQESDRQIARLTEK